MSSKTGRNEPCPCGSGKKYKNCCAVKEAETAERPGIGVFLVLLALVGGAVVLGFVVFKGQDKTADESAEASRPATSIPVSSAPAPTGQPTSQPPGPAPPGKVWSPEHGHWHDVGVPGGHAPTPASPTPTTSGQLTPQPPGPAPPGKVWSPEHGHWHDAN